MDFGCPHQSKLFQEIRSFYLSHLFPRNVLHLRLTTTLFLVRVYLTQGLVSMWHSVAYCTDMTQYQYHQYQQFWKWDTEVISSFIYSSPIPMDITAQGKNGIQVWLPRALPTTSMALFQMNVGKMVCKLPPWKEKSYFVFILYEEYCFCYI